MDNTVMADRRRSVWLLGLLVLLPLMSSAVSTVTVKVNVVAPPCTINGDRPIEVEFGDVMTTRVDGNNYRMPVNYTLDCKGALSNAMKLQMQGIAASFDNTLLLTSNLALGIKLQVGANTIPINFWVAFTYPNKPQLWVVPVKQNGATLTGGVFTAVATMKVDYQ